MHIKVTDFGTAKILKKADDNEAVASSSFVGTAEYVSPELLNEKVASAASDIWALGCIIYQLLSGRMPFHSFNEYQTFQLVLKCDYSFPDGFDEVAKDLVENILVVNPTDRMKAVEIKEHEFYSNTDWDTLIQQTPPVLRAYLPRRSGSEYELRSDILDPPRESTSMESLSDTVRNDDAKITGKFREEMLRVQQEDAEMLPT